MNRFCARDLPTGRQAGLLRDPDTLTRGLLKTFALPAAVRDILIRSLLKASFQRSQIKMPLPLTRKRHLCPRLDSNQHTLSGATTSKWCVYQFRHPGIP